MEKRAPAVKAPGLKWRLRGGEWIPYWVAQATAVKAGYPVKTARLSGMEPDQIVLRCQQLTAEMREWMGEASDKVAIIFDGTLASVIRAYQNNEASPYRDIRPRTKRHYDQFLSLVERAVGAKKLATLSGDDFRRWHAAFKAPNEKGKETPRSAQAAMTMIRIVINYGATVSDRACAMECARLSLVLKLLEFKGPKKRKPRLTYEHAVAVIAAAHKRGDMEGRGIAFGQALQFELMLRQTDVIGTWAPVRGNEPKGAIIRRGMVWSPGLDWSMVGDDWILRVDTSKTDTEAEFDLRAYPLVWAEISRIPTTERTGPMVKRSQGTPFDDDRYRKLWRIIATEAGVPKTVWNMDSRAGAVTEAIDAGAGIEHVRHHATHSDVSMTARYDRATVTKTRAVAKLRAASRRPNDE